MKRRYLWVSLIVVSLAGCTSADPSRSSPTAPEAVPTTTTTFAPSSTTTQAVEPSTTTTTAPEPLNEERIDRYVSALTVADPIDGIPESAPELDCQAIDPDEVSSSLGLGYRFDLAAEPLAECDLDAADDPGFVSVMFETHLASERRVADGQVPRSFDAIATRVFGVGYSELSAGASYLVENLPFAAADLAQQDSTGCNRVIVGNEAEFYYETSCSSSTYTRTYPDGSALEIWTLAGLMPEPLLPGFEAMSRLADVVDGRVVDSSG